MNFSYANRVLKAELQRFLDLVRKDAKRPVAKLFFDLVYGVMRSGSTLFSRIGRALCKPSSINVTENRLTQTIASADPSPIESTLVDYALGMSSGFLALDESDVQKPYGKSFQWLDEVMDGSDPDKRIGALRERAGSIEAQPRSLLDKALRYMNGLGEELYTFLSDGRVPMDNNLAERVVKPFVIDRKNFLFSKSASGAEASATMMTVIRTALRNGLIPERYLAWLFENSGKLPTKRLMPWSEDVPDSCKALSK